VDAFVQIAGYNSRRFYVLGEVARPGPMRWTGCDTLLDVLAQAQPTDNAWPERIIVIRATGPTQGGFERPASVQYSAIGVNEFQPAGASPAAGKPGGKGASPTTAPAGGPDEGTPGTAPHKLTINLLAMVQHGDLSNNILLRPNDIVYVQPNPFATFALWTDRLGSPFRSMANGLDDYRQFINNARWIRDGQPMDAGAGRATIIGR